MTADPAVLHEWGVAATARGAPVVAAGYLRDGLRLLGWPAAPRDGPLAARLLISLAHAEAEQGRLDSGIALLDEAKDLVSTSDRGVSEQQRGLLLLRAGRFDAAKECFDVALPLLAANTHRDIEARTLLNRGVALQAIGQIAAARRDYRRCSGIARQAGLGRLAVKAEHNAGCCDFLDGDIPGALRAYANAERALGAEPGLVGVILVDRARAVLAAGLVREAQRDLDRAIELFARQRLRQDQAEAELARAHTSLAAGDDIAAVTWAHRAAARFQRRGNGTGVALAGLVSLRVQLQGDPRRRGLPAAATALATKLRRAGLPDDADLAMFTGVRALIARGDYPAARAMYPASPRRFAPVEVRLIGRLAAAELAVALGRPDLARRQVNAGLAALHAQRSRLGSLDLQVGMLSPAVELAALGTRLAWQTGSARQSYASTERARAQSQRIRSVRPVPDAGLAAVVAELRQLRAEQRQVALSGTRPSVASRARLTELERLVRRYDWETGGSGHRYAVADLSTVVEQLDRGGATMISLVERGDEFGAIVISPGARRTVTMADLGSTAVLAEAAQRVRADIDILASLHLSARLERSLRQSLAANVAVIDAMVTRVESQARGQYRGPLVIVPTGAFWLLPWACLPSLRGRPVSVPPSATSWTRSRLASPEGSGVPARDVAVIGGPDLAAVPPEIAAIAAEYSAPRLLSGEAATVQAALHLIDGVDTVHIAAHGEHDPDNGLFSRIWLADGPLMAYDLQHLAKAPRHVMLAACDVGRVAVHPGDDLLGLASAFLHAGTQTVVASVARVADQAALRVTTQFHHLLAGGATPAEALGRALVAEPDAPFVCFGAG